ncbi:GNAT family N-acetyltransferase [Sediminicola arcticus]|jgi:N-acetylglutamate synthase-like GNAT family acetyltransferase|uniref:GNAT family N-acetyltransferase n=1 Tax=Sediminicola arcticus TaxID=1574308 RepID=A0ABV2SQ55_9FLAO
MNYRKAKIKDLDELSVMFDAYRVFYRKETDIASAKNFLTERILKNDSEIFVAENSEHQLVGFVQLYPLFSSVRMKKLWMLNDLFVNYICRKKGISLGLIDKAKELVETSHACGMFLETEKSNLVGNNLYPKSGFKFNQDSNYYEWYRK